jgi:hypothetical protein
MPLKKSSEFNKVDYDYTSPDGESYVLTTVDTGERRYIEVKTVDENGKEKDKRVYDLAMWFEIVDEIRREGVSRTSTAQARKSRLFRPNIVDFRGGSPSDVATATQHQVDKSMQQIDESVAPVESLGQGPNQDESKDEYNWEEDAKKRAVVGRPAYHAKASSGQGFRRVDASELI